jgi:hypothetical protein
MMAFAHLSTCIAEIGLLDAVWTQQGKLYFYDDEDGTRSVVVKSIFNE